MNATAAEGLPFIVAAIPQALRDQPRFVPWALIPNPAKPGKFSKVPQRLDNGKSWNAGFNDRVIWQSWPQVEQLDAEDRWHRFGWSFVESDTGIACIDFDHCRDRNTERTERWAYELCRRFASYTELSPSGTGLHVWVRLRTPSALLADGGKVWLTDGTRALEVFSRNGFVTLTGQVPAQRWLDVRELSGEDFDAILTGWRHQSSDHAHIERADKSDDELRASEPKVLRAALNHLPNDDMNYNEWQRIGYAVKGALGDEGFDAFDAWSQKSTKYDARETRRLFDCASPRKIGAGTIYYRAEQAGWQRPPDPFAARVESVAAERVESWPAPLDAAAYHGLAGRIIGTLEPHSESDPVAMLVHFLAGFGILCGRWAHYFVEGARHYPNLFALIVGETSKGRKGTSWSRPRQILEAVFGWPRVVSGLSSGEGLKFNVRDAVEVEHYDKKTKKTERILTDSGVGDKRLLVIESEFAGPLRVVQRDGNTLSATVRDAWDTGNLQTLTKHDPITATGAHIGICAHISVEELRAELTATDLASGFGNRFLFTCARRSKQLPFGGGDIAKLALDGFAVELAEAAHLSKSRGRVAMSPAAAELWCSVYPNLSAGSRGLFGAATARAEAQCVRLALIYALLDGAAVIELPHLKAALALWRYCEESARFVFGDALGDRVADEIFRALQQAGSDGLSRTQISQLFGRNQSAERIGAALGLLMRVNRIRRERRPTAGHPLEVWLTN